MKLTIESIAKLLIIDNQNRCLVLTIGKHLQYPEKSFLPDLPGGIVDPGESEQSAAIREAQEECGIHLDAQNVQLAYAATAYYAEEKKSITKMLYIARVNDTPTITLSWEHSDYKWVPISELHTIALRPFFKEAIDYSIKNGLLGHEQTR
jgi:8-oxo-dGTP pyrophosphatase MutT (NUDIX family)